ncbi:MAG: acyl transferase, partial [Chitinophagales bacterium]|nr:acyl transferase [Chitinophagales bacterium]
MERELPLLDNFINITPDNFIAPALQVFYYQAKAVPVYRDFLHLLDVKPEKITALHQIPFLPVELFKTHSVIANGFTPEIVFESSGTTDSITSKHPVANLKIYRQSILQTFKKFYGNPKDYCILALLP